jgi:hypothetical protein
MVGRQAVTASIVVQTVATCFVAGPMRLGSEPQYPRVIAGLRATQGPPEGELDGQVA